MDLMPFYFIGLGVLVLGGPLLLVIAGYARMRGRRSRFDRVAQVFASTSAAGIYPPSLRPQQVPEVVTVQTPRGDAPPSDLDYPLPRPHALACGDVAQSRVSTFPSAR
jgi:hypothetical protein